MDRRAARTRRRGRELAVQMLFCRIANPASAPETIAQVAALTRASQRNLTAARPLAEAVWERQEEIDRCLEETARPYWVRNMGGVELSVLRVAVAEFLIGSAPPRVVLNEAIEVARRFSGEPAAPFVHAVLDGVGRRLGLLSSVGSAAAGATETCSADLVRKVPAANGDQVR